MNVMVIAPHPDDEAIGCGGSLCLHASRGDRVVAVFLTSGELGLKHVIPDEARRLRENEAAAAAEALGIQELVFLRQPDWCVAEHIAEGATLLRPVLTRETPALIYLPHPREWHPDHQAALPLVQCALADARVPTPVIECYEVWTPLAEYDRVQDISTVMTQKIQAIARHRSQVGYFRYDLAVLGLNQYRGALAGRCRYAEVFQHAVSAPTTQVGPGI